MLMEGYPIFTGERRSQAHADELTRMVNPLFRDFGSHTLKAPWNRIVRVAAFLMLAALIVLLCLPSGVGAQTAPMGPTPVLWLQADAIQGVAAGMPVRDWVDSAQPTKTASDENAAPTFAPTSIGSLPVVHYDGTKLQGMTCRCPVHDSFTIAFVFRATQGVGVDRSFYSGAALVQAYAGGQIDDFGTSLLADGSVAAGTGDPDTTVVSKRGFDDGKPHEATFVRDKTTGMISLYVDGVKQGTQTGGMHALTSPNSIGLGVMAGGGQYFTGDLAEVRVYNTALSEMDRARVESELIAKWLIK